MRAGDKKVVISGDGSMTLLERVENIIKYSAWEGNNNQRNVSNEVICAVRDALQQPIMPEQPDDTVLQAISKGYVHWSGNAPMSMQGRRCIYNTLRAALCEPPKPKMKTVWCVAFTMVCNVVGRPKNSDSIAKHPTKADAERSVEYMKGIDYYTNISPIWIQEVEDK